MSATTIAPLDIREVPDFAAIVRRRIVTGGPLLAQHDAEAVASTVLGRLTEDPAGRQDPPGTLRASKLGQCLRAQAYAYHGVEPDGHTIEDFALSTFWTGDLIELKLLTALREGLAALEPDQQGYGWCIEETRTTGEQREVYLDTPVGRITGHTDAPLVGPGGVKLVGEVKSCTKYARQKWDRFGWTPEESYWWQLQAYIWATDSHGGYALYEQKDTGQIGGIYVPRSDEYPELLARNLKTIREGCFSVPQAMPDGSPVQPNARGELGFPCTYCAWFRACWPMAKETWAETQSGAPKRVLKVDRSRRG